MSYKQAIFKVANPAPQSVAHFLIIFVPFLPLVSVLVEATSYPSIKMGEVAIPFKGRLVYRPTVPLIDGMWNVKVPESVLHMVKRELVRNTATPMDIRTKSVTIHPLGLGMIPMPGVTLHDVWLKERAAVDLNSGTPLEVWKWNVSFRYSMIEESTISLAQAAILAAGAATVVGAINIL